jgi:hypothetical protein
LALGAVPLVGLDLPRFGFARTILPRIRPLTDEDRAALREAREDVAAGRVISMEDLRRELEATDAGRSGR